MISTNDKIVKWVHIEVTGQNFCTTLVFHSDFCALSRKCRAEQLDTPLLLISARIIAMQMKVPKANIYVRDARMLKGQHGRANRLMII
jgi:hypothetical protein